jgi:hypothetical protein
MYFFGLAKSKPPDLLANANLGAGTLTGFLLSLCEPDRTGKGGRDLGLGRR